MTIYFLFTRGNFLRPLYSIHWQTDKNINEKKYVFPYKSYWVSSKMCILVLLGIKHASSLQSLLLYQTGPSSCLEHSYRASPCWLSVTDKTMQRKLLVRWLCLYIWLTPKSPSRYTMLIIKYCWMLFIMCIPKVAH